MLNGRESLALLALVITLPTALVASCGDGSGDNGTGPTETGGGAGTAGASAAGGDGGVFYPVVEPTDPCLVAGYFFDGESDCNVVRCPELSCECSSPPLADAAAPPVEEITLSACVPGAGCLNLVDCERVCDPANALTREACELRIASAGSQSCTADEDCLSGECREESIGPICVDVLRCGEDGHCSVGSACLFDPDLLDPDTSLPTTLGTCADGSGESLCFEDGDCVYGTCLEERCTAGLDGEPCSFNSNCASGFCRITNDTEGTGSCVSGEQGDYCTDDGDCSDGLHCTGSVCVSNAVGQSCESDEQCASGICVSGRCRTGQAGSWCEDDDDCTDGFCVGYVCVSGTFLAPCSEPDDCADGLVCARRVCSDGSLGAPCETDEDCTVLACVNGSCSDGSNGSECEADDDCASNRCANPAGVEPGECTSGAPGSVCIMDSHCDSGDCALGNFCD